MATLAEAAQAVGLDFGFAFNTAKQVNNPNVATLVVDQSTVLVDEWQQLMSTVQPSQGVFTYTAADALISWAQANNLRAVQGGHLIWHGATPSWVTAITNPATLRTVIETHVQTVMSYFGSNVWSWNVINEVIGNAGGYRSTHYYDTLGDLFVKYAFDAAAVVALPFQKLIWNDFGIEWSSPAKFNTTLTELTRWLNDGVRIDGFGTQTHMSPPNVCSPAEYVDRLNQIAALGLDIYVTELDVYDTNYTGTADQIKQQCADLVYSIMSAICRDVARLKHVVCWSPTDSLSWLNDFLGPRGDGIPRTGNPYDRSDPPQPNPMRQALIDAFALRAPTTGNVANALANDRATITVATPTTAIEVRLGTDVILDHNGVALTGSGSLLDQSDALLTDQANASITDNAVDALTGQTTTGSESVTLTLTGGT